MLRTLSDVASSDQRTTHQGEAVHRRWSFRLLQDLCTEKRKEGKKKQSQQLHHFYHQTERIFTGESLAAVVGKGKAVHVE